MVEELGSSVFAIIVFRGICDMITLLVLLVKLSLPILLTVLFFLIHPVLGVISTLYFIGICIYAIKKK